jgi:predicted amidohydrolase
VIAIAQVAPVFLDIARSVERAADAIAAAAREGADLVVFSEAWLCGYPIWVDRGIPWEDPATKRLFTRLHANAVTLNDTSVQKLCSAARKARIDVAIGAHERAENSVGTLYNSILYLSRTGEVAGVHRKLVPTHSERIVWGQGDGSTLTVLDTNAGRVGGLICWEHWMPLARQTMHAKREQLHVALWPDMPDTHHLASRSYAFEGRCYVAAAAGILRVEDIPASIDRTGLQQAAEDGFLLRGGSAIYGPDGQALTPPLYGEEQIIAAEIDLAQNIAESQAFDPVGHYSRPDIFRLTVNEQPQSPVSFAAPPSTTADSTM